MKMSIDCGEGSAGEPGKDHPSQSHTFHDSRLPANLGPHTESSRDLKSIHDFVDASEKTVTQFCIEVSQLKLRLMDDQTLFGLAERFGELSRGADDWGFEALYWIGFNLQTLLLDLASGVRSWDQGVLHILEEAEKVLSLLLSECERDYQRRIQVAGLIQSLDNFGANPA